MAEREQAKEKDIEQVVRYLTTTFNKAKSGLDQNFNCIGSRDALFVIIRMNKEC